MKKLFVLIILTAIFFSLSLEKVEAAAPIVNPSSFSTVPTGNPPQVGRYQKIEATFQISRTYPAQQLGDNDPIESFLPYYYYDASDTSSQDPGRVSPYGVDGITINAHFASPSGKNLTVPAFYYQDYGGNKAYSWKIRFAPEEVGSYAYYLTVEDKNGSSQYPVSGTLSFQATSSSSKGFIRVSSRDSRFWEFSNGEGFIPISTGHQWPSDARGAGQYYSNVFSEFKLHGINFLRIWDQNDGYNLTVEGHYDAYNYPGDYRPTDTGIDISTLPKGTQMNQRSNYEEDIIINAAVQNGVYIQLCSHGDIYWLWDANTYNPPDGYDVLFNDQRHNNYWKRNLRYRIARWGYSTSVFAWEFWNEQDRDSSVGSDLYNHYQNLGDYLKQNDPYQHLRTTSHGSQVWSPAMWNSPAFDIANYHDYMMSNRYPAGFYDDEAKFVYTFAQCLRAPKYSNYSACPGMAYGSESWSGLKPIVWGEMDTGTSVWNQANPQKIADHNAMWAGLFSPIGMVPIDWYYSQKSYNAEKYDWLKITSDYFSNVDYAGEKFDYLSTSDIRVTSEVITATNSSMRVLAMRSNNKTKAFAWAQHKNYTWGNGGTPSAISGNFTIPQMASGNYTVEYWNTETGQKTSGGTVSSSGGNVSVSVSGLNKSLAIKIISTTAPPATPTPSPTTCIPGDANNDKTVNLSDFTYLLTRFRQSPPQTCADQQPDGIINAVDLGFVLFRLL